MTLFYLAMMTVLLISMGLGIGRLLGSRQLAGRLMAAQLLGTTSVAILLLWGAMTQQSAWRDVALVIVLLAAITGVAFVRLRPDQSRQGGCDD